MSSEGERRGVDSCLSRLAEMSFSYSFERACSLLSSQSFFETRNAFIVSTGSRAVQDLASALFLYRVGSSAVECGPTLYVRASMRVGPPPLLAFSRALFVAE